MRIPPMVRVVVLFATVIALAVAAFLYVRQLGDTKEVEKPLSITAETPSTDSGQRGIFVQGAGEVRVRPDTAFVSVGAENTAETAADASGALAVTASAIVEAIKALGVPASDIATERLSLYASAPDMRTRLALEAASEHAGWVPVRRADGGLGWERLVDEDTISRHRDARLRDADPETTRTLHLLERRRGVLRGLGSRARTLVRDVTR